MPSSSVVPWIDPAMSENNKEGNESIPAASSERKNRANADKFHFHVNSLHQSLILSRTPRATADTVVSINSPGSHDSASEDERLPPERLKTLAAFLFMVLNLVANLATLSWVHDRVPDRSHPGLPDIVFSLTPLYDDGLFIAEIILIVMSWTTIIVLVFHRHRYIIFRRLFMITGILYFWRSVTMLVTQLPIASPTYYCSPKANYTTPGIVVQRLFRLMSGFGLSINGQHVFCGDFIYSGHTVILILAYLMIKEYGPKWIQMMNVIFGLLALAAIVLIVVARAHYTVDVLIAYFVTTRIFWVYHTLANNPALKVRSPSNFLANCWWFRFFLYLEKNVQETVPREFVWPIRWHPRISTYVSR